MSTFLNCGNFWMVLALSLCLPLASVFAQEAPAEAAPAAAPAAAADPNDADEGGEEGQEGEAQAEAPYNWKEEREVLRKAIAEEVKARVSKNVQHSKTTNGIKGRAVKYENEVKPIMMAQRNRFYTNQKQKWMEEHGEVREYPDMTPFLQFKLTPIVWKYPIKAPTKKEEDVRDQLEQSLFEAFDKACPAENHDDLVKKGKEKYPLIVWKAGMRPVKVKFRLRGGKGANTNVDGFFRAWDLKRIKVNERWVNRIDMDEEAESMFYPEVNKRLVDDYVNLEMRKFRTKRDSFVYDWMQMLLPDRLISAGYVPEKYLVFKKKTKEFDFLWRQSSNLKSWIPAKDFELRTYKMQLEAEQKRQTEIVTKDWFTHASQHDCREDYVYCEPAKDYVPTSKLEEAIKEAEDQAKAEDNQQ